MTLAIDTQYRLRQRSDEVAVADEIVAQMDRERRDDERGRRQSPCLERIRQERISQGVERRHGPWLVQQVGERDAAAARPSAVLADNQGVAIAEQDLGTQLFAETTSHGVFRQPGKDQIDLAFEQFRK